MPKSANQKLKLLYLMKILLENTDEEHPKTISELISALEGYGIGAERKSLYDDIRLLQDYGLDIVTVKGKHTVYYVAAREFEFPELKLLVDVVQASKFITPKKSDQLIKKLESFTSTYRAHTLHRQVFVANRVKALNETIYYAVDDIYNAINADSKIRFQYYEWTPAKVRTARHDGAYYLVSPWGLTWNDENYYLIAYVSEHHEFRHYRVDKIGDLEILDERREGADAYESFDIADYTQKLFGMFNGEEAFVSLLCENSVAGSIIDRFGQDIPFLKRDNDRFEISVKVALSPQFYAWVFGFSGRIRILSPESAVTGFRELLDKFIERNPAHQNHSCEEPQ